jgi:hypothetical protein
MSSRTEILKVFGVSRKAVKRPTRSGPLNVMVCFYWAEDAKQARRQARAHGFAAGYACREFSQAEYEASLQGAGFGIEPAGRVS